MSRPKGVIQKRNESKYWLPLGVTLKPGQSDTYRKDTSLIFIDNEYGEFISNFKALQDANASTHPKAVCKRRELTNIKKYGCPNPSSSPIIKQKRSETFLKKYGASSPFSVKEFKEKAKSTLIKNYNVTNPMFNNTIKQNLIKSNIKSFGTDNPMKNDLIKDKLKNSIKNKYGVDNFSKTSEFKIKFFESQTKNGTEFESSGEKELKEYIQSLGFDAKKGYTGGASPKSLDIVVSEKNIAFEYNGMYWHSEANKNMYPNYHLDKTIAASNQGKKLIHVFEQEWLTRKNQVKSFIRSILGKNEIIIMARKCEIREVSRKEANSLLEECHILGPLYFKYAYGLYYNNELVCLATLGSHHRGKNELILNRYVGKTNVTVSGGLSKLSSFIKNKHGTVYTWVDRRISDGSNWIKAGWSVVSILPPDYFYWDIKRNVKVSKQSRRKSKVRTPDYMTEHEHALKDGLRRVYDCGKIKLKL